MDEKIYLSLCIITENDKKHLPSCLQNIKEVVDEIIVVKLGSKNLTVDIDNQKNTNVYHVKWENNYSVARNYCIDKAKGRWILFLQDNETISKEQLKEIYNLLDNPNIEGYLLYLDYPPHYHRIFSPVQSLRLIRNRKEYRYKYKAFERIPDELLNNIQNAGIRIKQENNSNFLEKIELATLLLEEDMREYPEDSYLQYIYGIELLNQTRYEESFEFFQRAHNNVNHDYLFAPHLYKCLSWTLISLKRYSEALDVLKEGVQAFPFYTDLLVLRGELRKQLQQYEKAIQDLEKSLKIRKQPNFMVPRPEINISVILQTLGEIHEEIFNYHQSLAYYGEAYKLNETNPNLLYKIGILAKKTNSTQVLENLLKEAIERKNIQQMVVVMDIFVQQRRYTKVLENMEDLESFIGKGDQIESIKSFCYGMLGKVEEAELHFAAINKYSPFYYQILLYRIETYWFYNQWQEARKLLDGINDVEIENIGKSIIDLYQILHSIFTGKEINYMPLAEQEYEIVSTLMENLLWLKQIKKAKLIVPLLLQEGKEDQYIKLAEAWAEENDFNIIEKIFGFISDKQKQLEFKQKIILILLYNKQIESAQKVMDLGEPQSLGPLEFILWSKGFLVKLEKWIEKVSHLNIDDTLDEGIVQKMQTKAEKDLLDFYDSLGLNKKNLDKSTRDSNTDMTYAKIHDEIGDFYIKAKKKKEGITAYLRALQWDPLRKNIQEKIGNIFCDNPSEFHTFLRMQDWILEGYFFNNKDAFIDYILGVIHFIKRDFESALRYFVEIGEDEASYPIVLAYRMSILWLVGKDEEAGTYFNEYCKEASIVQFFCRICKDYALDRLNEGYGQYSYSELIILEKQNILNSK